jgi:histidyl-tRNA synthetase
VFVGEDEKTSGSVTIKDMATGRQETATLTEAVRKLNNL